MKTKRILTTLVVSSMMIGATAMTSGCKREPVERTETQRSVDENLSESVRAALRSSASFKFPDVQVTAFNGSVQLSGYVVSEEQKKNAEALTKEVPGVVSVENKISLKK